MKIHLDYLEGRVEELENINMKLDQDKKRHDRKLQLAEDKFKLYREEKDSELDQLKSKNMKLQDRLEKLENLNKDILSKYEHSGKHSINNVEFKIQSGKNKVTSNQSFSVGSYNDKNIYQTISEISTKKNSYQNRNPKQSFD